MSPHHRARARTIALLAALIVCAGTPVGAAAQPAAIHDAPASTDGRRASWSWPLAGATVTRAFQAPPGPYAAGHRGIDMTPAADDRVRAPASGIVAFAGPVAGRPVVTIDHGNGVVTTLEPVASGLAAGEAVMAGAVVGSIATGGHALEGSMHMGVRVNGEYVNPLLFLGGVPRAVLLPCCA